MITVKLFVDQGLDLTCSGVKHNSKNSLFTKYFSGPFISSDWAVLVVCISFEFKIPNEQLKRSLLS